MRLPLPKTSRALALPLAFCLACGAPEGSRPSAPVPPGWRHWDQNHLEFDCPSEWKVLTRNMSEDALEVFLSADEGGKERCLLVLHFGPEPRFPTMDCMKPFARQAFDTRIGGARTRRIDPPEAQVHGASEGIIELGGGGPFHRVHFKYASLDASTKASVEQVLASLRNRTPRA